MTLMLIFLLPTPQIKRIPEFQRVLDLPRNCVKLSYGGDHFEVSTFRGYVHLPDIASAAADAGGRAEHTTSAATCQGTASMVFALGRASYRNSYVDCHLLFA
jgi:hypothetical protein